jgi:quercetin dioxygenase-like cupin family protein
MDDQRPARADRPAASPVGQFRIDDEVVRLKQESAWQSGTRNAITLVKHGPLRVVLIVLRSGTHLEEHHAIGPLSLHVLSGVVRVRTLGRAMDLGRGTLLALEAGVEHDVEALEESTLLLNLVQLSR